MLVEDAILCHKDVFDEVGMIDLNDPIRPEPEADDIAELLEIAVKKTETIARESADVASEPVARWAGGMGSAGRRGGRRGRHGVLIRGV